MMIGATTDDGLIKAFLSVYQETWGPFDPINPILNQRAATASLIGKIGQLKGGEPLALFAHGNDTEMGDDGGPSSKWEWTAADIAAILKQKQPIGGYGPIFFGVCCETVANFSAHVAVALGDLGVGGVWCWGFNRAWIVTDNLPPPDKLAGNPWVQGTQSKAKALKAS